MAKKKKSLYKKSLLFFTVLLILLSFLFLVYVFNSMIIYERNLESNYIAYLVSSGKIANDVDNNLFTISKYEKNNAKIKDGIKKILKSDKLVTKKNSKLSTGELSVYDIKIDSQNLGSISIKSKKKYKRMAILTINEWEVTKIDTDFKNGIYNYEISIPTSYKLYINDKLVDKEDITSTGDVASLEKLTKYIEISKSDTYTINNLVYEPKIKILDEAQKEVKYELDGNKIIVTKDFKEIESLDDAKTYIKDNFNILQFAENYSLYLTNDVGFYRLSPYLIKDSLMYNLIKNTDVHFTSNHRFKNPRFTNEEVKNFIIYNENAFSVHVYLEKNMIVSGKDKVDTMNDRLYFIYYDGGYKLVDMKSAKD